VVSAIARATFMLHASVQFVVLTACAMLLYPGGTSFDPTTKRYGFFLNFFSDLGMTATTSGAPNWPSFCLFVVALATIGVALVLFSGAWRAYAFDRGRARWLGWLSQAFGVTSGLGFVGIALTPWNLLLAIHITLVLGAFALLLGFVLCLVGLMIVNGSPRTQVAAHLAYVVVLCGYVYILFFGPTLSEPHGHFVQVAAQKVIVYTSMVNLMVQSFTVRRTLRAKGHVKAS